MQPTKIFAKAGLDNEHQQCAGSAAGSGSTFNFQH